MVSEFHKWAWSGSHEHFLHCELRKFRHSKSSVYRWYTQLDHRRSVYDTWDSGSRLGRVMVECTLSITHCLRLNRQLHTINLVRTCRISSFCTVAWQLARFQLTRRIARSLGDSWASCPKGGRSPFGIWSWRIWQKTRPTVWGLLPFLNDSLGLVINFYSLVRLKCDSV